MNWKQNRREIKGIGKSIFGANTSLCIGASLLVFILIIILPLLISNKFMPTVDITSLYNAYTSGADMSEIYDIYMGILTALFTGRNVALMLCIFLLCVLIGAPAAVGSAAFFTDMADGKAVKAVAVLHWYSSASLSLRAFLLVLLVIIINAASFLIIAFIIPYLFLILLALIGINDTVVNVLFVLFYIICFFCLLVLILRFCLSVFIMAAYRCGIGKAISVALKITKKRIAIELFIFVLSFIVWILICILTFGAGLIFILPYLSLSLVIFTKRLLYRCGLTPPPSVSDQ